MAEKYILWRVIINADQMPGASFDLGYYSYTKSTASGNSALKLLSIKQVAHRSYLSSCSRTTLQQAVSCKCYFFACAIMLPPFILLKSTYSSCRQCVQMVYRGIFASKPMQCRIVKYTEIQLCWLGFVQVGDVYS